MSPTDAHALEQHAARARELYRRVISPTVEAENEDLDQDQVQDQDQDVNEDLNQSTSESEDEQDEGDNEDGSKVDPSMRLINTTPINIEQQIDDPVTSGGDIVVGYAPN